MEDKRQTEKKILKREKRQEKTPLNSLYSQKIQNRARQVLKEKLRQTGRRDVTERRDMSLFWPLQSFTELHKGATLHYIHKRLYRFG